MRTIHDESLSKSKELLVEIDYSNVTHQNAFFSKEFSFAFDAEGVAAERTVRHDDAVTRDSRSVRVAVEYSTNCAIRSRIKGSSDLSVGRDKSGWYLQEK